MKHTNAPGISTLKNNIGQTISDPMDCAHYICDQLFPIDNKQNDKIVHKYVRMKVQRFLNNAVCNEYPPITVKEVEVACNSMKCNSAPGLDRIFSDFVKALPCMFTHLANVFNSCLLQSYYPKTWKKL